MRTNPLRIRSFIAVITVCLCGAARALAQQSHCTADPSAASCGLDSTAHLLSIAAVILGVVLLVIVAAAVVVYQRNKSRKLTPDD